MFNESSTEYVGGRYDYSDMCSIINISMMEIEVMIARLGYWKGFYSLQFVVLCYTISIGLMPFEDSGDFTKLIDLVD